MDLIKICLSSTGSVLVLFILIKILGNRQMSQLTMFDYINGITIGSIAAEMATSLEDDFMKPLFAMIVYTGIIFLLSMISEKSIKGRKLITGQSFVLYTNGKLLYENFKKAKLDIDEFLTQCRINGYFNISDLEFAMLENNGHISFMPKSNKRFVTPEDLNLIPEQEKVVFNIILDGQVIDENLKASGNNITWLENNMKNQKISNFSDVFLATCDSNNNLSIYTKNN